MLTGRESGNAVDSREGSVGRVCSDGRAGVPAACGERHKPPGAGGWVGGWVLYL